MNQYERSKDGMHHVYLLPEENYVGKTQSIQFRMSRHKNHYKRNINGMRVLASLPTKELALELEALLHDLGYEGRSSSTFKKGNRISENCKKRLREVNNKPVAQIDKFGMEVKRYNSIKEAGEAMGMKTYTGISNCLAGRIKSSYGYKWQYVV